MLIIFPHFIIIQVRQRGFQSFSPNNPYRKGRKDWLRFEPLLSPLPFYINCTPLSLIHYQISQFYCTISVFLLSFLADIITYYINFAQRPSDILYYLVKIYLEWIDWEKITFSLSFDKTAYNCDESIWPLLANRHASNSISSISTGGILNL